MSSLIIAKIVAGGQTGADRGGLDAALELGLPVGGFCPAGRKAEDGIIPKKYDFLKQTVLSSYAQRTEANVKESDLTLVFTFGSPTPGSQDTLDYAARNKKDSWHVDLTHERARIVPDIQYAIHRTYQKLGRPIVVNIAGSRGSKAPLIQEFVSELCLEVFRTFLETKNGND